MATAWVLGPERPMNKQTPRKQPSQFDQEATFFPDMMSNDVLRDSVRSSGYGYVLPGGEEDKFEGPASSLRIIEEMNAKLVFKPELVKSPTAQKLRSTVNSSGYGKRRTGKSRDNAAMAQSQQQNLVEGLFKPRMVTAKTAVSLRNTVNSSGYGKKLAQKKVDIKAYVEEKPKFQPNLATSKKAIKYREGANSTGYGRKIPRIPGHKQPTPRTGPKPIPRSVFITSDNDAPKRDPLEDRAAPTADDFVLDCVKLAHISYVDQKFLEYNSPIKERADVVVPDFNKSAQFADISSSQYGVKSVPGSAPRPRDADDQFTKSGEWKLFRQGGIADLDEENESWVANQKNNGKMRDVPSSGYGVKLPENFIAARPEEKPVLGFAVPSGRTDRFPEAPPPKINHVLNNKVGSHGYGVVSPAVAPKKPSPQSFVWVPSSFHPLIPKPDVPKPNRATGMVASHYGDDYDPATDGMYLVPDDEQEYEDEDEEEEEEEDDEEEPEEEEPEE